MASTRSLLAVIAVLGSCVPQGVELSDAARIDDASVDAGGASDAPTGHTDGDTGGSRDAVNPTDARLATDAGTTVTDAATPTADAGATVTDAGTTVTDAGAAIADVPSVTDAVGAVDVDDPIDAATADAPRADTGAPDAPTPRDAAGPMDATGPMDAATPPDAPPVDVPTDIGLPPLDAWSGALPTPARTPADWGPLRVTTRTDEGEGLAPVERRVYGYAARRVNYVDTERWSGSAWTPFERTTYAYTAAGTLDARIVYRFSGRWTEFQRWRLQYNPDGTLRGEHGDIRTGGAWGETMQLTWEWYGGLPAWQRYYLAPAVGSPSVKMWENTFEYDATGRFTSYWRIERTRPTATLALAGRWTPTARATGHVDRETFTLRDVDTVSTYRYDAAGRVIEVAGAEVDRYLYDPRGRLQFVRTYVFGEGTWHLSREVEIEGTDEGGDLTWALDPYPHETWRRDLYGRGDLVDRYRH